MVGLVSGAARHLGRPDRRALLRRQLVSGIVMALLLALLPAESGRAATGDLVLEQIVTKDPPQSWGEFGKLVALDGDRLAVFANEWGSGTFTDPPMIAYYRRSGQSWALQYTIAVPGESWVGSLDLSGATLAVGLPGYQSGRVLLYTLDQPSTTPFVITDPFDDLADVPYSGFGEHVALDDDRLIVGGDGDRRGVPDAFVYQRSGSAWVLDQGGALPPASGAYGGLGHAVDISGNLAVVTEWTVAYVYRRSASGWAFEQAISSPDGQQIDLTGGAVIADGTVVVSPNSIFNGGTGVFVFTATGSGWVRTQQWTAPDGIMELASSGSELALFDVAGRVRVWDRDGSQWVLGSTAEVKPDGTQWDVPWAYTTPSVDVSHGRVALGILEARPGDNYDAGSVRMLRRGGTATKPPGGVTQLRVVAAKSNGTVTVSWAAATGQVSRYRVTAEPQLSTPGDQKITSAGSRSVTFTGLRELAPYRFGVQAAGPGGDGPLVRSGAVTAGGPKAVSSPYVLHDRADTSDARQDVRSLTVDATGAAVTLMLRTSKPRNPYTDPMFRRPIASRFYVTWRVPAVEWTSIFDHAAINDGLRIPGEDFTLRFKVPRPCRNPDAVFAARYVDGAYQATVPSRCFNYSRALRFSASSDVSHDSTSWSPPVTRLGSKGSVSVSKVKVSSVALGTSGEGKRTISFTASHSSGIKSATIRAFSLTTGQRPIRVGKTTCVKKSKKTSVCRAKIRLRPGEVRDQDAGRWRVFVEVKSRRSSIAVKEDVKRFSVRRSTKISGAAGQVEGRQLTVSGTLRGASWNKGGFLPLTRTSVLLERKAPGAKAYKRVATLQTSASGAITATVATSTSGRFRLRFATTSTYNTSAAVLKVRR